MRIMVRLPSQLASADSVTSLIILFRSTSVVEQHGERVRCRKDDGEARKIRGGWSVLQRVAVSWNLGMRQSIFRP